MADTSIFDPVQAAKSGPLDLTDFSDQQLFQHLSDPAKFRAAIPDYAHLSDNDIRAGMQRTAARNPAYVAPSVPNPILKAAQMRTSLPGSAYGFATEKVDPNDPVQNALVGAGSAALQTMRRVKNVAEPAVGPLVQPFMELAEPAIPQSVLNYAAKKQADVTTATNAPVQGTAQKIGYTGEQIGEYLAAPESEIAAGVSKVLAPAAKYAPKLVAAGSRILASGATGGTVAALHGESPVKGAEYGAGGSLLNETLISPAMKYASQYLPARMMNCVMRTPTSGFNYGRDPGRRVAEEGYVAATKNSLLNKIGDGLKDAGQAIDTHLSDPAVDKPVIDLTNAIHEPIDKAKNIALAGGNQALYRNLEALEDGLTKSFGPLNRPNFTGVGHTRSALVPNANLPLSGFTPLEANRVKQFVGESARWNGDPQFDQLSPVKRQIYGRINDLVEQAAPGIKAINQKVVLSLLKQK